MDNNFDDYTLTPGEESLSALEQELTAAETGSEVRVYRQDGTGREPMMFIHSAPADQYGMGEWLNMLAAQGGGDFRFHLVKNGKMIRNRLVRVAPAPSSQSGSDSKKTEPDQSTIMLMAMMEKMLDRLESLERRPAQNDTDILEKSFAMAERIANLSGNKSSTTGQLSEVMETMTAAVASMAKMNVLTMAKENSGDRWADLVDKYFPDLIGITKYAIQKEGAHDTGSWIQKAASWLLSAVGHDPGEVGKRAYDMLMAMGLGKEQLAEAINGQIMGALMESEPGLVSHADWVADCVQVIEGEVLDVSIQNHSDT